MRMTALARAGIALLAAFVIVPVLFVTGIVGGSSQPATHLTAYFTRTISLYPQSDVRILGLPAGTVERIKVVGTRVRVDFTIRHSTPVPPDVKATIVPLSLIGERYLQLFPAWTGGARIANHAVIPLERTSVPVEPDEALASLKNFLEDLNPDGAHRLVSNLAEDLAGQGQTLNDALHNFATVTETLASRSDSLGQIIDNFDAFTTTLVTRERELGQVMDDFASVTGILADERQHIEGLVHNLSTVAAQARDLIATHKAGLDRDLTTLGKVAKSIDANLGAVTQLLDSGPALADGLQRAYNPAFHRIDLRNSFSPTAAQVVRAALGPLVPSQLAEICVSVDVTCTAPTAAAPKLTPDASATAEVTTTTVPSTTGTTFAVNPSKPADDINDLLNRLAPTTTKRSRSSIAGDPGGVLHTLGRAAHGFARVAMGALR